MKTRGGWSLIELIVYMSLASTLVGLVYATFHRSYRLFLTQERALEEVCSSLTLEERLSRDVRSASRAQAQGRTLTLTTGDGRIIYSFDPAAGALSRTVVGGPDGGEPAPFTFLLAECLFEVDRRMVSVTYRRMNATWSPRGSELPVRKACIAMWLEE